MAFQLLIARGNGEGQQFVVVQPVVLIGKDADNDVVLSDAGVSRQHARIVEKLGKYFAEDLGSAGGTFVNGDKVAAPRELKTGDSLALGTALLRFVELDDGRAKAVPKVPVANKAITGEQPALAQKGSLPPPVGDHEIVTASGEGEPLPWERTGDRPKLYDDAEVTAPVGRPLVWEDNTVPVGSPLKVDATVHDAPKEPEPAAHSPLAPTPMRPKSFDVSEQKTTTALPEPDRARLIEGPTQIKPPAPLALDAPQPSFNKLLRDEVRGVPKEVPKEEDSLAPLDLSRSDLQSLQKLAAADATGADATRADAAPLHEDSTGQGPALARPPSPRLTHPLVKETAAERSRRRRLLGESLGTQAGAWWGELPLKTKAVVAAVAGLISSVVVIGLVQFFRPDGGPPLPSEPDRLLVSHERVRYFFGLGDGVEYQRPDSKEFSFDFVTPTDAAILIHYQAREIGRDEVAISVNGADVGFVPPDINVPDREIETLVPQRVLKRGEKNTLVFDNVHNPPGKDPWRVGELWLELLPVPPSTPAEALRRARELGKQASQLYAQRDVGSDNIFRSWKAYRLAWQVLLAVPEGQRTSLFDQMRARASELAQQLDQQCGQLMLDAKKQMELKNPDKAKEILDSVSLTFPTNEHRCHQLANERLDEYQL